MNKEGEINLIINKTAETINSTLNYKLPSLAFFFDIRACILYTNILTRAAGEVETSDVVKDL